MQLVDALSGRICAAACAARRGCPLYWQCSAVVMHYSSSMLTHSPCSGTSPRHVLLTKHADHRRAAWRSLLTELVGYRKALHVLLAMQADHPMHGLLIQHVDHE